MATLQRSAVSFRRQGSSGIVWDDKYALGENDQILQKDQLRHCQSVRDIGTMDQRDSNPTTIPRSFSAPGKAFRLPPALPKSGSGQGK
ncbi:hypothetical protein HS088_TW09G01370 [Tripterygium wilfordii]|uniref:Uncharacterized protein n=1 Tax=Tripterygium wilfordii TaxID=458696 RepID=A0A7J7DAI7_TRIWF|nr:hypothetical protein HS088_TW09G01370 [Tripterygium wilfordii]